MRTAIKRDEDARARWHAAQLNRLFQDQGLTGEPGRIKPETLRDVERDREDAAMWEAFGGHATAIARAPTSVCGNPSCGISVPTWRLVCPRCGTLLLSSSLVRRQSRTARKEKRIARPSTYPRLPDGENRNGEWVYPLAEKGKASRDQLDQAKYLRTFGLTTKAKRQAHCRAMGFPLYRCRNNQQHKFYGAFSCGNRYCLNCGPLHFKRLFDKYERSLHPVVDALVPAWRVTWRRQARVVAVLDWTILNTGEMPTRDEIRQFNSDIKTAMWTVAKRLGFKKGEWGYLWCDEFGAENSQNRKRTAANPGRNLHAHGMYVGPWIDQALLSEVWQQIRKDGSRVVWIKRATGFAQALAHALKYTGKQPSKDPKRLAELEKAFHRVRRVHPIGAFFKVKDPGPMVADICCPQCDGPLEKLANSGLRPSPELQAEGWLSWTDAQAARKRAAPEIAHRRIRSECRAGPS